MRSSAETPRAIRAGERLPPLRLVEAASGQPRAFPVISRDALALLLLPADAHRWDDYLRELSAAAAEIRHWYARILVVVPGARAAAQELKARGAAACEVYADAEAAVHAQLGVAAERAALLIVDRYAQVYHVAVAEEPRELLPVREVEEWVKFLATQCPECGVIDEPGYGEWSPP